MIHRRTGFRLAAAVLAGSVGRIYGHRQARASRGVVPTLRRRCKDVHSGALATRNRLRRAQRAVARPAPADRAAHAAPASPRTPPGRRPPHRVQRDFGRARAGRLPNPMAGRHRSFGRGQRSSRTVCSQGPHGEGGQAARGHRQVTRRFPATCTAESRPSRSSASASNAGRLASMMMNDHVAGHWTESSGGHPDAPRVPSICSQQRDSTISRYLVSYFGCSPPVVIQGRVPIARYSCSQGTRLMAKLVPDEAGRLQSRHQLHAGRVADTTTAHEAPAKRPLQRLARDRLGLASARSQVLGRPSAARSCAVAGTGPTC